MAYYSYGEKLFIIKRNSTFSYESVPRHFCFSAWRNGDDIALCGCDRSGVIGTATNSYSLGQLTYYATYPKGICHCTKSKSATALFSGCIGDRHSIIEWF